MDIANIRVQNRQVGEESLAYLPQVSLIETVEGRVDGVQSKCFFNVEPFLRRVIGSDHRSPDPQDWADRFDWRIRASGGGHSVFQQRLEGVEPLDPPLPEYLVGPFVGDG